jgi:Tfp pilus assembly protein PilX
VRINPRRDEQGSSLVLALHILTVIGIVAGAALTFASTSMRASSNTIQPNRAELYAADSAIKGAIGYVRANPEMATDVLDASSKCLTGAYRYTDPKAGDVVVDVCPRADSLIYEGNFRAVLLTLGTTATDGIILGHNGDVNIGGHVWSNSKIDLSNPTHMVVDEGRVWAWGDCTRPNNIEMAPDLSPVCNASTTFGGVKPKVALDPADPSLGHEADWQPAAAPTSFVQPAFPACIGNNLTLTPGVYYDGDEFSAKTNACATTTLSPGVYYLDFPAGKDEWALNKDVVGQCAADGQGVQLVFADSAHIKLSGTLTIPCGRQATPSGPHIALYGLKTDITSGPAQSWTLRPTGAASASTPAFGNLPNAVTTVGANYPQDGSASLANVAKNKSAALAATGFDAAGYPAGTALKLRVAHSESNDASVTAVVKSADNSVCTVALSEQSAMTIEERPVDCPAFTGLAPLQVTYTVTAGKTLDAHVDGMELVAAIPQQTVKAQNGCVVKAPGASGYCPLITPPSNGKGNMVIQAVVYIPQSTMAGKFNNSGNFKIGTALVARSLDVDINPNLDGSPVIGEDDVRRTNGDVVFRAKIGAAEWTSSQVVFPALPNDEIGTPTIKSWVIQH